MKIKHIPLRRCIGCNQSKEKNQLIRIVKVSCPDNTQILIDLNNKLQGRGTYICKSLECLKKARKFHRFEKKLAFNKIPEDFYKNLESKINNE